MAFAGTAVEPLCVVSQPSEPHTFGQRSKGVESWNGEGTIRVTLSPLVGLSS